jgi:paraquat-inducible protein A
MATASKPGEFARREGLTRTPELAICRYCDTVHQRRRLVGRGTARCVTCDAPLYRADGDLGAMLAVAITATVAFAVANLFPLVTIFAEGHRMEASLGEAVMVASDRGLTLVAMVLFVTLIAAPLLELGLLLWVLVPLCAHTRPPGFAGVMRLLHVLLPWRMVEVFLLGVAVAIVKLGKLATVQPGWGVFGIAVLTLAMASLAAFDRGALWRRVGSLA